MCLRLSSCLCDWRVHVLSFCPSLLSDKFWILAWCFWCSLISTIISDAFFHLLLIFSPSAITAEEDPEVHLGQLKRFSLRELQVASDNFNNRNILGRGGFGKVYKGRLADGTLVAIKRLKEERSPGGELQFQTEVNLNQNCWQACYTDIFRSGSNLMSFCSMIALYWMTLKWFTH